MYGILGGLRIVEGASFIAAPTAGLHLHQLGADVIRFDAIGGGPDFRRWPTAENGRSLYWEGLNKGKRSIALDLGGDEGRELALALAAEVGILVTNYPADGFLSHDRLAVRRVDMITVRIMGWHDGANALDYTVNAAVGVPFMTGPEGLDPGQPVNHVLPAWDLVAGGYAAFATLAAERRRMSSGIGGEVRVPLGDVAIAALGSLGQLAEVSIGGSDRPRVGNDLYGAFGRDFPTRDGRRLIVSAITGRQWRGLLTALDATGPVAEVEAELGVSFDDDEGARFRHRDRLNPIVARAIAARDHDEVAGAFDAHGATWGSYRTLSEALKSDPRLGLANPLLADVAHVSGSTYVTPGSAATLSGLDRGEARRAPRLGEHSEEILAEVLNLPGRRIADLIDRGVVGIG